MKHALSAAAGLVALAVVSLCAAAGPVELFPGVTLDREAGRVEFAGSVPIQADAGDGTVVFLEVMVCLRDTKEHEALVATDVKPSHVHAALLALGLEPGAPGEWLNIGGGVRGIPAHGPPVRVEFITARDGTVAIEPAATWVARDPESDGPGFKDQAWLFSGSRMVDRGAGEVYDADGTGLLIGLTMFGSEVLSCADLYSHDSGVEEPVWIADPAVVPPEGTPVTVRLTVVPPAE